MQKITANIIGYAVKSELVDVDVDFDTIQNVLKELDLPENLIYKPKPKNAVVRAAREVAKENGRYRDHLARRVKDNKDTFVMSVVDEERDAQNETLHYEQSTTIRFDKNSESVNVEGPLSEDFRAEYEKYSNSVNSQDIRNYVYRVIRYQGSGVSLVHTGGLYFVPENKVNVVEKLDQFLKRMSIGRVWYKPEIDDQNTREWVWSAAVEEVTTMVKQVVGYINNSERTVRENTLRSRGAELVEKADLVKAYANLTQIGSQAEDVIDEINSALGLVAGKIRETN